MAKRNAVRVTPSTGNVFRDLGFSNEESEHLLVRADLLIQVQKAIASNGLKQPWSNAGRNRRAWTMSSECLGIPPEDSRGWQFLQRNDEKHGCFSALIAPPSRLRRYGAASFAWLAEP